MGEWFCFWALAIMLALALIIPCIVFMWLLAAVV